MKFFFSIFNFYCALGGNMVNLSEKFCFIFIPGPGCPDLERFFPVRLRIQKQFRIQPDPDPQHCFQLQQNDGEISWPVYALKILTEWKRAKKNRKPTVSLAAQHLSYGHVHTVYTKPTASYTYRNNVGFFYFFLLFTNCNIVFTTIQLFASPSSNSQPHNGEI